MGFHLPQQIYSTRPWARKISINDIAANMDVAPLHVLTGGSSSIIFLCENDLVLKLLPSEAEANRERDTLSLWPIPDISPVRAHGQALVLRYHHGQSLNEINWSDDIHQRIFQSCQTIHSVSAPPEVMTLRHERARRFQELRWRLDQSDDIEDWPYTLFDIIADKVLSAREYQQLIHGDFQPGNLLLTRDGIILPIDPKGFSGDPYYDYSSWIVSGPHNWHKRFDIFIGLLGASADPERLMMWCEYLLIDGWISAKWRHSNNFTMWNEEVLKLKIKYFSG